MEAVRIGFARCSTDRQDLSAQRSALVGLGVDPERIYTDHGLTGRTRARPGLDQALAAVRCGDQSRTTARYCWGLSCDERRRLDNPVKFVVVGVRSRAF